MHKPFFLENSESSSVVVFIHGFMGSPQHFEGLAKSIQAQGHSVASLLLPGHASTAKAFSLSTMEMWQDHVNTEVERLTFTYRSIFLVGHSMGCLLAINAAIKYCEKVTGLYLIACPFVLNGFSMQSLRVRLKQTFYRKNHPMKSAYIAGSSVPLTPGLIWRSIKPAAELKKLMRVTKENLCNVRAPVTAVYSPADEIVSMKSLDVLKSGLTHATFDYVALSDSNHAYYPDPEQAIIESSLLAAVPGVLTGGGK